MRDLCILWRVFALADKGAFLLVSQNIWSVGMLGSLVLLTMLNTNCRLEDVLKILGASLIRRQLFGHLGDNASHRMGLNLFVKPL